MCAAPVGLVWGVEAEVGDVGCVEAGEALDLVREPAVLVARLKQLAPHLVEALVVLLQQAAVPLANLRTPQPSTTLTHHESSITMKRA